MSDPVVSKFLIGCIEKSKDLEQHIVAVSNSQSFQQDALDTITSIDLPTPEMQNFADTKAEFAAVKPESNSQTDEVGLDDTPRETHTKRLE